MIALTLNFGTTGFQIVVVTAQRQRSTSGPDLERFQRLEFADPRSSARSISPDITIGIIPWIIFSEEREGILRAQRELRRHQQGRHDDEADTLPRTRRSQSTAKLDKQTHG